MKYFWLTFTAAVFIFLVNIIGFIDTRTGSAMGCGSDFPLCNGKFYPDFNDIHSIIEYTHRLVVGLASIFLFAASILALLKYKSRIVRWSVFFALIGLLGESVLGALTVMMPLSSYLLAAHLGIALLAFSGLVNLAYVIYQREKQIEHIEVMPSSFTVLSWFSFFVLYLAVYFGGYVAKTASGTFFKGIPFPTETFAEVGNAFWIDVIHRSFALILVVLFFTLFLWAKKYRMVRKDIYRLSILNLVLIFLQGLSGYLLVYTHLSLGSVLLHVSTLTLTVATLSIICIQSKVKKI
jgi:heme a synthase